MKTQSQATPRPWKYNRETNCLTEPNYGQAFLCLIDQGASNSPKSDAELIVKAVNSYDELVETLKRIKKIIEDTGEVMPLSAVRLCKEVVEKALSKAKGG